MNDTLTLPTRTGSRPRTTAVMLYAPRDDAEVKVVTDLVRFSYHCARGRVTPIPAVAEREVVTHG